MNSADKIKKEVSHKIYEENRDSLEIGNSKTGKFKVYFDAGKPDEAKKLIESAIELRDFANAKIAVRFGE